MNTASVIHTIDDVEPSIRDALHAQSLRRRQMAFKRGDRVATPTGRVAEIRSASREDILKWSDKLSGRACYRVRFLDDESVAQFRADWLEAHCQAIVPVEAS